MTTDIYTQACELLSTPTRDTAYGSNLSNILEAMIDRSSLATVLQALSDICNTKATHISDDWQDDGLARAWHSVDRKLDTAIREAKRCEV